MSTFLGVTAGDGDGDSEEELEVVSAVMSAKRRVEKVRGGMILTLVRWMSWEEWMA